MTAEAGVVLAKVQDAALDADAVFPLSLAAEGRRTIGGNISTNAGGVNVLRYGMARALVLGLEVVLADGRVLDLLRTLRKDNTGYDLKQLFIGAEGTLGVITAAALRLFPKPATPRRRSSPCRDPEAAVALLHRLQDATGGLVSAFELMPRQGLEFVLDAYPERERSAGAALALVRADAKSPAAGECRSRVSSRRRSQSPSTTASSATASSPPARRNARRSGICAKHVGSAEARRRVRSSTTSRCRSTRSRRFSNEAIAAVREARARRAARAVRPSRRRQHPFQFQRAQRRRRQAFLARWDEVQRTVHDIVRDFRRLDQRRAWHRRDEARRNPALQERRRKWT